MTDEEFMEMAEGKRRLSREEASDFLTERGFRVSVATLSKYACNGGGPIYEKFGRRPLYTEQNLLDWARRKTGSPLRHSSDWEE